MTHAQLRALGLSRESVAYRCRTGGLVRVFRGVYAVGHSGPTPHTRADAAVLAGGEGAALSHDSAAALWKLRRWPQVPEISSPVQHRIPGIKAHRTVTLVPAQVTTQRGIRVTTPARTIHDIGPRLTDAQLIRAIHEARRSGIMVGEETERLVTAYRRAARLVDRSEQPSESALEDLFRDFLRRFRLPRPEFQPTWNGHRRDAIYWRERVIIELDGRRDHELWDRIESDHIRDAVALEHGFITLRITKRMLKTEPHRLAAQLRAILAARAPSA